MNVKKYQYLWIINENKNKNNKYLTSKKAITNIQNK